MAATRWPTSQPKPGSLTRPFARHLTSFLLAVAGAVALARIAPPADQPLAWLAAGMAIGFLIALGGGGWLSICFAVVGVVVGLWLDPSRQSGPDIDMMETVSALAPAYVGSVIAAVGAYAVVRLAAAGAAGGRG